jgi:hypothetical protein
VPTNCLFGPETLELPRSSVSRLLADGHVGIVVAGGRVVIELVTIHWQNAGSSPIPAKSRFGPVSSLYLVRTWLQIVYFDSRLPVQTKLLASSVLPIPL